MYDLTKDYNEKEVKELIFKKKLFVLDMDGTFYLGDSLIEGSLEFMKKLELSNKKHLFFTNNSSKVASVYVEKLNKLGFQDREKNILTSGDVTAGYLNKKYSGSRVYVLGTQLLKNSFIEYGINVVTEKPDIVVAAFDTTIDYKKLEEACRYIRNGALFIATHPDLNCPVEDGFIPDCGAICAFIKASTGVNPVYIGKPNKHTIDYIISYTNYSAEEIVVVGDRLYTDIAIGVNNNISSILVLTGETKYSDLSYSNIKPEIVVERLSDLCQLI